MQIPRNNPAARPSVAPAAVAATETFAARTCAGRQRHLLTELVTGRSRPAIEAAPAFSSAGGPWADILIEQHRAGGFYENPGLASPSHLVVVQQRRPVTFEWAVDGAVSQVTLRPGQAAFIPAMLPHQVRTPDMGEFVAVSINPAVVRRIAHELVSDPGRIEWRAALPLDDPLLASVTLALLDEAKGGYPAGVGYGDALTHALAAHLLRRFAVNPPPLARQPGAGLARAQLRRALEFLQANLAADISLDDLAREAGLSRFHFARMFKRSTGVSPHQYLLQCRVERARELLLAGNRTIAEIAAETGFYDQSHLVSQFKRAFGVTPRAFRRHGA
jgi:AraC family transcriptional regulator